MGCGRFYAAVEREVIARARRPRRGLGKRAAVGRPVDFGGFEIVGRSRPAADGAPERATIPIVSPGAFCRMDLADGPGPGRSPTTTPPGSGNCIVNEAFVRRHLAGRDADRRARRSVNAMVQPSAHVDARDRRRGRAR